MSMDQFRVQHTTPVPLASMRLLKLDASPHTGPELSIGHLLTQCLQHPNQTQADGG